jgi:molybdopterin-synthase adenylyltransferase
MCRKSGGFGREVTGERVLDGIGGGEYAWGRIGVGSQEPVKRKGHVVAVKVRIPTPLLPLTNGADVLEITGANVGEVLHGLSARYTGIDRRLFKPSGELDRHVNVFVNDEDIRSLENLETAVKDGDDVRIVPAIAGGRVMARSDLAEQLEQADPALARYNRQMLWQPIGVEGQKKLRAAKVLLVGCGALGTTLANLLARAGVGHLTIADRDYIEVTNLQRQVLFDHDDIEQNLPKAVAAQKKLARINPDITVEAVVADVNHTNIEQFAAGKDLLLDGTDNFETRFLINDVSVKHKVPWIYGAVISAMGLAMTILPEETPCLRCLFESAPPPGMNPTCDTAGVLGPTVSVVASWQALEAMKLLTGNRKDLSRCLFSFDMWENRWQQLNIAKAREAGDCTCCKRREFEYLSGKFASATTSLCGRNAVQISRGAGEGGEKVDFARIAEGLRGVGKATFNKFMLKCAIVEGEGERRKEFELTLFADGRAIIKGTNDARVARNVYAKYVGA